MEIHVIAAVTNKGVIGNGKGLPWHIPEDLKRFKRITSGKTVLMGRTTYETIGRPLPNRINIVLDQAKKPISGAAVFGSLPGALKFAEKQDKELYVIGGASVYAQMLPQADVLHLSHVKKNYQGDVYFPKYDKNEWRESEREEFNEFTAVTYERKFKCQINVKIPMTKTRKS